VSSRSKIIVAVVGLLVVAGVAAGIGLQLTGPGPKVDVSSVQVEDLAVTVTTSGRVDAGIWADVYPPSAGTLDTIQVEDGQQVASGTVLARMDGKPFEAAYLQAQSALAQAEAQAAGVDQREPTSSDVTAARAGTDAAWAQYESALAALEAIGDGAPSSTALAAAQAATDAAYSAYLSAKTQYDYVKAIYDTSSSPTPSLEASLTAAEINMKQAKSAYLAAKSAEEALRNYDDTAQQAQLEAAVDQAYAGYLSALAQQRQVEGTSVSAERSAAQAAIEQAREGLVVAEDNLRKSTLRAPIDGVVVFNPTGAPVAEGSVPTASEGTPVTPQSAPFTIMDLGGVRFTAEVDEVDVGSIDVGLAAGVNLDAFSERTFDAVVVTVMPQATLTPTGGTVFPVYLAFEESTSDLLVGMKGDAEIEVSSVPGAVTIPVEALFDEGGTTFAYVVRDDDTLARTRVEVGTLTETRVQITGGLRPGDTVALSGATELVDGMKIERAE